MAGKIIPTPVWSDIDEIAETDVVKGGPGGKANSQAQGLANRVEFLKQKVSANIPTFDTPDAGVDPVTGVADGAYFNVRSSSDDSYLVEYQNIGGVPTPSGKSYPSAAYVQNVAKHTALPFVDGKTYSLNERVQLENGDIVKSTVDGNVNDPNVDMTGWEFSDTTYKSINDMLEIESPKNGQRVYVESYNDGLGVGGKFFIYSASKSTVNDGGRCINGWIAQKEVLDIHDFGTTKHVGTSWSGADYALRSDAWAVSSDTYNKYRLYCDSVKQQAIFPNGDFVIEDASYKLPICGLTGQDKDSTRIFTAVNQAGKIFEYNTLNTYSVGHSDFVKDLTIYTHRANTACWVLTINTPSRGTKGDSVNIYSSGEIINYYDVWYLKWENCGFYGYTRSNESIPTDPYTAVAFVNKNNGEHNNTFYDKCAVLDVKHVFRGRKAGFSSSGVGLLFANCSFERIGECAFDLMYTNTTFLTCHFEQLGKHFGFKTPVTDYDRTILIYAGENTVSLVGSGNIWLGGNTPDSSSYSIFNSEGRALIDLGFYRIAKNNRPQIAMSGTYASGRYCTLRGGVVVNSEYSNTTPIDLHFSNIGQSYRQKSNQSQGLIANIEKASTTYQSVDHHPLITGAFSSRSICVVSARIYANPVLIKVSGRIIRVGNTVTRCAQYLNIDASFLIEPSTPLNPQIVNFNVEQKGVDNVGAAIVAGKSLFGAVDEAGLKALFVFKRLTASNTDNASPFDVTYAMTMSTAWLQFVADVGGCWQINDIKTEVVFPQDASSTLPQNSYIHNHNNVFV